MSIRGVTTSESEAFLGSLRLSNFLIDPDEFYEGKSEDSYTICRIATLIFNHLMLETMLLAKRLYVVTLSILSQITTFLHRGRIIPRVTCVNNNVDESVSVVESFQRVSYFVNNKTNSWTN